MWFYKGKIVKIQATTQTFIVALFYKLNPTQNTTVIAQKYRKFIELGTSHSKNKNSI